MRVYLQHKLDNVILRGKSWFTEIRARAASEGVAETTVPACRLRLSIWVLLLLLFQAAGAVFARLAFSAWPSATVFAVLVFHICGGGDVYLIDFSVQ